MAKQQSNKLPSAAELALAATAPTKAKAITKTQAKRNKREAPEFFGMGALEQYLSPEQCESMGEFATLWMDKQLSEEAFTVESHAIVGRIFARAVEWATWKPVIKSVKDQLGARAAMSFRAAYKAKHGNLPSAGTGTGSGTKGMSPKRFATGLETKVAAVVDYIAKAKADKLDVNAVTLAKIAKLAESLMDATIGLQKAVAE